MECEHIYFLRMAAVNIKTVMKCPWCVPRPKEKQACRCPKCGDTHDCELKAPKEKDPDMVFGNYCIDCIQGRPFPHDHAKCRYKKKEKLVTPEFIAMVDECMKKWDVTLRALADGPKEDERLWEKMNNNMPDWRAKEFATVALDVVEGIVKETEMLDPESTESPRFFKNIYTFKNDLLQKLRELR